MVADRRGESQQESAGSAWADPATQARWCGGGCGVHPVKSAAVAFAWRWLLLGTAGLRGRSGHRLIGLGTGPVANGQSAGVYLTARCGVSTRRLFSALPTITASRMPVVNSVRSTG